MTEDPMPIVEVYRAEARVGRSSKKDSIYIWLIKYNGLIHEGGWSKQEAAFNYAEKLVTGQVKPKLLPASVEE
jgi:hypothetical protein